MAKKKKVPPPNKARGVSKKPKIASDPDEDHKHPPAWHIETIQQDGPFGWNKVDGSLLWNGIMPKLKNFETMNWGAILGSRNHEVAVSGMSRAAQKELQKIKLNDIEKLVSLRLTGKQRVWGIKIGRVLKILWWDPEHKVYPSVKKHT